MAEYATNSAALDLHQVRASLLTRLKALEARLKADQDEGPWRDYLATLDLLLRLEDRLDHPQPSGRAVLTTREMAERLGISVKALLRRKKLGRIRPSVAHGKALGWRVEDALR